jgi:hypothetical protein
MNLIEERRRSQIRQKIRRLRQGDEAAQLKINLDTEFPPRKHQRLPEEILIEEIGWEAYEWQRR